MIVVHRHPGVAAQFGIFRLRRHQRIKRQHELVDPPVIGRLVQPPLRRDAHAEILPHAFEGRAQVARRQPFVDRALGIDPAVQDRRVSGIDFSLQRLQPVAFLDAHREVDVFRRDQVPFQIRQRRQFAGLRSHIGPDHAVAFPAGIGGDLDLLLEPALHRLGRGIHHRAGDVEFPAVIDAAQTAILVAAEHHRRSPMRAGIGDEADPLLRVAERDEILAEQHDALRPAVGDQVLREEERYPVTGGTAIPWRCHDRPEPAFHCLAAKASAFLPSALFTFDGVSNCPARFAGSRGRRDRSGR